MSRLRSLLFWVGLALAAVGALLFVRPSLRLGGIPPLAWFSLAALSLAAPAFRSPKRMRQVAAVGVILCVLAGAGVVFDHSWKARRARAEEDRLKQVLPLELPHLSVGGPAPEIEARDLSGQAMRLSDHRGKVVLLVFWATWCGPCMGDVPHEKALVERFSGRPFALVGVNGDASIERARAAVERHAIPWRSFWDPEDGANGPIATHWGVQAWPTVYVIDDQGVIRHNDLRGDTLDAPLERLVEAAEARAAAKR